MVVGIIAVARRRGFAAADDSSRAAISCAGRSHCVLVVIPARPIGKDALAIGEDDAVAVEREGAPYRNQSERSSPFRGKLAARDLAN